QALISRKQDDDKTAANLAWIRNETSAHIHADLIAGLPGEDIESFASGFNRLSQMNPHEIQLGILKRLPGTPIIRHTERYAMVYSPFPPYNVLSTSCIDFHTMQRINRFARYWDMIANSGRFATTKPLILAGQPFERFMQLTEWLFKTTKQTHKIALKRLFNLVHDGLVEALGADSDAAREALWCDFQRAGLKGVPDFMQEPQGKRRPEQGRAAGNVATRQSRHN
ncbi:MAG TPA: DUF4080 domain-containing protein, partial [Candidatus Tenderia sp.]|nr:DUF4080 domain-containing protein [Candidatus Tenderia sp.]